MLLVRPGDGGRLSGSTNCCEVAQVPTQIVLRGLPLLEELELEEFDELLELEELLELDELEALDELDVLEELDEFDKPVFSPPQPEKTHRADRARLNEQNDFITSPNNYFNRRETHSPKKLKQQCC